LFHRHFNHEQFGLAAIDRGKRQDLAQLPQVNPDDRGVMEKGLLAAMSYDESNDAREPTPFSPNTAAGSSEPRTKSDSRADPYWA
jgi:hypothetical protein